MFITNLLKVCLIFVTKSVLENQKKKNFEIENKEVLKIAGNFLK